MAETIDVKNGTRIRQDGKSYVVATPATVDVNAIAVESQKNPWKAVVCLNKECDTNTGKTPRQTFRAYRAKFECDKADHPELSLPLCGSCGQVMDWKPTIENL